MIPKGSWRKAATRPLDPSTGNVETWTATLSATDAGAVSVLHVDPGGSTDRHSRPFGQLVIVIGGSGMVEVGDERTEVVSGDTVRWPRDVAHRLTTRHGLSVLVLTYEEGPRAWRVTRVGADGSRWVVGVFDDTDRAKAYRERVRLELAEGEDVVLE